MDQVSPELARLGWMAFAVLIFYFGYIVGRNSRR